MQGVEEGEITSESEDESDYSEDESDEDNESYVRRIEEQVALHDLEYKTREQQEAVTLTETRCREIAIWSKQASNISKAHLEYLKISEQEEIELKQTHTELHQIKGGLKGQLIFDIQARLQKKEPT
jgi:hypothetical protein